MRTLLNNRANCIQATKKWFEHIVIGRKLCPFASIFLTQPELLRISPCDASSVDHVVQDVRREVDLLVGRTRMKDHRHETTLIVFPERTPLVDDFRDLVRLSWTLQEEAIGAEYQPKLQLVLFHPRATHQTYGSSCDLENAADYTIRSPYPTIHLLREVDVMRAVQSGYPNLEALPARNQKRFHDYGVESCQENLAECYKSDVTEENK